MGLLKSLFNLAREPDEVFPVEKNLNNYVYLNASDLHDYNLFEHVNTFIAREFTKVIITMQGDISAKQSLNYLLNVRPNNDQTGNEMLYEFAKSLLDHGFVYYKCTQPASHTVQAFEISKVSKPGFKKFTAKHLKTHIPDNLLQQYSDLLYTLSTKQSSGVVEINTKLKADTSPDDVSKKLDERLTSLRNQINKFGAFTTVQDESSKDHQNLTTPDASALADLRNLIYEELNINPKILMGDYDESDYRAFYASHLAPLAQSLEELLNATLLSRQDWMSGARIKVVLDLLQFSTLENFTEMAKQAMYNGYLTADELREALGKDSLPDGLGKLVMSNKNAVALNDNEINSKLETNNNGDNNGNEND